MSESSRISLNTSNSNIITNVENNKAEFKDKLNELIANKLNDHPTNVNTNIATDKFSATECLKNGNFNTDVKFEVANKAYSDKINGLNIPKPSNSLASAIGRWIMSIVNYFRSDSIKSSSDATVSERYLQLTGKQAKPLFDSTGLPSKFVSMNTSTLGKLVGISEREQAQIIPFPEGNNLDEGASKQEIINAKLFNGHGPRLQDIKQNPQLQDCWFLSAIGAVLSSQGPKGITRLFAPSDKEGFVNVKLGTNIYEVPMGRIASGDGKYKFGSNSEPWVVVLENAMAMHLSASYDNASDITVRNASIALQDSSVALGALMGAPNTQKEIPNDAKTNLVFQNPYGYSMFSGTNQQNMQQLKEALDSGSPVVLGHAGGAFTALKDAISPQHAVTVLAADLNTMKFTVLDPYGQVKTLEPSVLKNCTMYSNPNINDPGSNKGIAIQNTLNTEDLEDDWVGMNM